jgi:hypothetical protein
MTPDLSRDLERLVQSQPGGEDEDLLLQDCHLLVARSAHTRLIPGPSFRV